uniref:Uncharacterized protein n=1 Tax=Manihot esculenta TaxID=3983 RepID=A0A2C9UFK4_MANES
MYIKTTTGALLMSTWHKCKAIYVRITHSVHSGNVRPPNSNPTLVFISISTKGKIASKFSPISSVKEKNTSSLTSHPIRSSVSTQSFFLPNLFAISFSSY